MIFSDIYYKMYSMKDFLRKKIREQISILFENDYFPTFEPEDMGDMGGEAKKAFLYDLSKEGGSFMEPTDEEINTITAALQQANLELPSDYNELVMAQKMIEKQLQGIKTPQEIARLKDVMNQMWGEGSINESVRKTIREAIDEILDEKKAKVPKVPKTEKEPKSTSQKKKKKYKIKPPKPPKEVK
jgi:hypothetical protein